MSKELFVFVEEHITKGQNHQNGDGSRYSGYHHEEIIIDEIGPCFFSEEGKGWRCHHVDREDYRYEKYSSFVLEDDIDEDCEDLYFVVVRYASGGTFGGTDGYYSFPFVGKTRREAREWMKENGRKVEDYHNDGHFEKFISMDIRVVEYCPEEFVENRNW